MRVCRAGTSAAWACVAWRATGQETTPLRHAFAGPGNSPWEGLCPAYQELERGRTDESKVALPLPLSCFSVSGDVPSEYPPQAACLALSHSLPLSLRPSRSVCNSQVLSLSENAPLLKVAQCVLNRLSWCVESSTLSPLPVMLRVPEDKTAETSDPPSHFFCTIYDSQTHMRRTHAAAAAVAAAALELLLLLLHVRSTANRPVPTADARQLHARLVHWVCACLPVPCRVWRWSHSCCSRRLRKVAGAVSCAAVSAFRTCRWHGHARLLRQDSRASVTATAIGPYRCIRHGRAVAQTPAARGLEARSHTRVARSPAAGGRRSP